MGAGASVGGVVSGSSSGSAAAQIVAEELAKPVDASDVDTPRGETALGEVIRLRRLLATTAAAAKSSTPEPGPPSPPQQPLIEVQGDTTKTCVERVQTALDAIAARDQQQDNLNCCAEVLAESALARAAELDARLAEGGARRPLEGVPVLIKVNIDITGTLSTASMPGLADWRPETTAPVVAKLLEAGAVPVAKTSMPELAFGWWGYSPIHGITKNARNPNYTTAGSSSGTASGIAAGLAPAGLGSDTNGSCRMPAECCGVAGLRPTRGRYNCTGIVPCDFANDTPGPMANTAADIAVLDAVITGDAAPADYVAADLSTVTVALPSDLREAAVPGTQRALDLAVAALSAAGATIKTEGVEWSNVKEDEYSNSLSFRESGFKEYVDSHAGKIGKTADEIIDSSEYAFIKPFFKTPTDATRSPQTNMANVSKEEAGPLVQTFEAEQADHSAKFVKFLDDNGADCILTPCTHGHPTAMSTLEEFKEAGPCMKKHMHLVFGPSSPLMYGNGLRIPSLALPTPARHDEPEGHEGPAMPAGVLLYGKPDGDKRLIEVAMALEAAMAAGN